MKWQVKTKRWYHKKPNFNFLALGGLVHFVIVLILSAKYVDQMLATYFLTTFVVGLAMPARRLSKVTLFLTIAYSLPILIYYRIWKFFNQREEKKYKQLMKTCTQTDEFFYNTKVDDFFIEN